MPRAYPASVFLLTLDGDKPVGFLRSLEGGGIRTDVIENRAIVRGTGGGKNAQFRQLARPKYEDIKIQVGMSMASVFYEWIEKFFSGEIVYKNGEIQAGDFHYKVRARRKLQDVLISEVTIPRLDGSDGKACHMAVTLVPSQVRFEEVKGDESIKSDLNLDQKLWSPNNFTFEIDGFEAACRRITKIDSFTIKQQIMEYCYSTREISSREALRVPGLLEFPNMTFYVPEVDADPFIKHFTRHVIEGEPQKDTRDTGELLLNDNAGKELCRISIEGIDIFNVSPDRSDSSSEEIKQVKVEITVEAMKFKWRTAAERAQQNPPPSSQTTAPVAPGPNAPVAPTQSSPASPDSPARPDSPASPTAPATPRTTAPASPRPAAPTAPASPTAPAPRPGTAPASPRGNAPSTSSAPAAPTSPASPSAPAAPTAPAFPGGTAPVSPKGGGSSGPKGGGTLG